MSHYTVFYQRVKKDGTFSPSMSTYNTLQDAYKQFYQVLASYIGNAEYSHVEVYLTNANATVMSAKAWDNIEVGE